MKITPIPLTALKSEGSPLQSLYWAQSKAFLGWKAYAFEIDEEQHLLLLVRRIAPLFTFAYVPFGPPKPVNLKILSNELQKFIAEPIFAIRYDLPFDVEGHTVEGLRRLSYSIQPQRSVRIDLEEPLAYRKRARRALSRGSNRYTVTRYTGESHLFDQWYETYCQTALRDHFHPRSKAYFAHLLSITDDPTTKPILLLAFEGEAVVGGILIIHNAQEMIYLAGSSIRSDVGYVLQDAALHLGKVEGVKTYDLFGISNDSAYLASLDLFKQSFGGRVVTRVPSLDYPIRPVRYFLFLVVEHFRYRHSRSLGQG